MSDLVPKRVPVGVGVVVLKAKHGGDRPLVMVGRRKGSHGAGTHALPGGYLEFGETFEACALRELQEETGIREDEVQNIRVIDYVSNNIFEKNDKAVHTVTVYVECTLIDPTREAVIMEPLKCDGWFFSEWDSVPSPRFIPLQRLLDCAHYSPAIAQQAVRVEASNE